MLKNCLVLKLRDFGENSLLVTVLHPYLGKQEFLARGGKHIHAKLTPALKPLNFVHLWLAPTRGEIATIREVEVIRQYLPSRYLALRLALRMCDLLTRAAFPNLECADFMRQTMMMLSRVSLQSFPTGALKNVWIQFELALLSYLGIEPEVKAIAVPTINDVARQLERRIEDALT